jgi:hypothetical protein
MKNLLFLFTILLFTSCFTTTSRVYDSDYNKTNRDIISQHLFGKSKAIPNAKLIKETLDSTSYRLEYGQGENCSGYITAKPYTAHQLKVSVNYGCMNLKHKNKTREEFLDELGGVLH